MSLPADTSLHVYTLTGNLLAERTLDFDSWSAGRTQRACGESFQVGGKGINVSKMLTRLGVANTALCFVGGHSGAECEEWLRRQHFTYRAFPTSGSTRTGTVIRNVGVGSQRAMPETTFLGPDSPPDAAALQACADYLDSLPDGGVLALGGSLPGWNTNSFDLLRAALDRWIARGRLVVDTYGPPLAWLAARKLDLIKVNAHEFQPLAVGGSGDPPGPTPRWVVSRGPGPVSVWDSGQRTDLTPPAVAEVSPTGSGDVLLACILHAFYGLALPLREAVAFALPYAAANAAHPGIAEFPDPK